jgi:hypothetical protein
LIPVISVLNTITTDGKFMFYVIVPTLLLVIGFFVVFLSCIYKPFDHVGQFEWIASSGALMASFGIVSEFIVGKVLVSDYIPGMVSNGSKAGQIYKKYGKQISLINVISLLWIIIGSVIWAYVGYFEI